LSFKYLFDLPELSLNAKVGLLVTSLQKRALHLCLNRGAAGLAQDSSQPRVYTSRQALREESQWWMGRLARQGTNSSPAATHD
jgi:hypothetical protein